MKRAFAIFTVAGWAIALILLHSAIRDFLWTHPWWRNFVVSIPTLALPILAYFELRHSAEVNKFRDEANELRREANIERVRANDALSQIAEHTRQRPTKAERNADKLRKYLRQKALVMNADDSRWSEAAEIVEIKDEVVTLFTPYSSSSSAATQRHVHCEDLELVEAPVGSLLLTIKVLKPYGTLRNLGEIKIWEERLQSPTEPYFAKGPHVTNAQYIKEGSQERKQLDVYESSDGSNNYMLVASPGKTVYGDNKEISRKFLLLQLEIQTEGFRYSGGRSGGSKHELYICTTR